MNIIWLGHGSFRIEIAGEVVLVDPWLNGNPMLGADAHDAAIKGATLILLTHAHFDHANDLVSVAKSTQAPVAGMVELMGYFEKKHDLKTTGFNIGGTITHGELSISLVPAMHSTSLGETPEAPMGRETGFIVKGEGHTIYISGDTGIMADMDWIGDYYKPDIGILSTGGHYTMGMAEAVYAAKRYFAFKTVIPCHYRTFPLLEQSAKVLIDGLPGVDVIEPEVMQAIKI